MREKKKHTVNASVQVRELVRAGNSLNLEIFYDEEKVGELIIGRGSLTWFGRNRHTGKRIPWNRFAQMMDELAYGS
jgi:hypothetical protein